MITRIIKFITQILKWIFTNKLIGVILLICVFISCEKNITLDLPVAESKLVVEGYIFQDTFPYVILTRNIPFFSTLDSSTLQNYIVKGATIIVSDGITTDTMTEFSTGQFTFYFSDDVNLKGQVGKTYTLHVEADGDVVTSSTTIPAPVPLDSVWWKVHGEYDTLGFAWAHLTDPDTVGNFYRWFAKRINQYPDGEEKDDDFIAPIGSTFEDKFINGKSFDFFYNRGNEPNSTKNDDNNEERIYFKKGDTIVVRFCTIDRSNFEFWRDEETQVSNNGNPFANPAPVSSNIIGGLGIWGGYSVTYDTIIAQ
jgi:hypothetical protein